VPSGSHEERHFTAGAPVWRGVLQTTVIGGLAAATAFAIARSIN